MTPAVLTQRELERMACRQPGCDHAHHEMLFLNATCHRTHLLEVSYAEGRLTFRCPRCQQIQYTVAVAEAR